MELNNERNFCCSVPIFLLVLSNEKQSKKRMLMSSGAPTQLFELLFRLIYNYNCMLVINNNYNPDIHFKTSGISTNHPRL